MSTSQCPICSRHFPIADLESHANTCLDEQETGNVPPTVPTTHSVALATIRDATVAFGAEYGVLLVRVEQRITQYLRQQRLFVVGGHNGESGVMRSCYSLDAVAGVWVEETPLPEGRFYFGLCASG